MSETAQTDGFRDLPQVRTCETCDWYCYGTWPSNTCDKWEATLWECEVPDDVLAAMAGMPTSKDFAALHAEIDELADGLERGLDGGVR